PFSARQFITCASDTAARRFPTPSGPAKMRLGGKVLRTAARAINSRRRRWPVMSRKAILATLLLFLIFLFLLVLLIRLLVAFTENLRPEAPFFLRRLSLGVFGCFLHVRLLWGGRRWMRARRSGLCRRESRFVRA